MELGHTYVVLRNEPIPDGAINPGLGSSTAYAWRPFAQGDGTELPPLASRMINHYTDGVPVWGERSTVMMQDAERDYSRCADPKKQPFK